MRRLWLNCLMRWIYLSPHLDDAVFSAGGLIYEQTQAGTPVEIWTIMCGDPHLTEYSQFAQRLHQVWGFSSAEETVRLRRAEDSLASSIVGAKAAYFDFLDCIYRRDKNGDWLYPSEIFGAIHEADADYPAQIASAISARLLPDDILVCQLGLGSHVDHILVRRAVELLQRPLLYYTDIPYLFKTPEELAPNTAGMKANAYTVSEAGLRSWQEAIAAYESQISSLFESPDHMRSQIRQYWSENNGIPLWSA